MIEKMKRGKYDNGNVEDDFEVVYDDDRMVMIMTQMKMMIMLKIMRH